MILSKQKKALWFFLQLVLLLSVTSGVHAEQSIDELIKRMQGQLGELAQTDNQRVQSAGKQLSDRQRALSELRAEFGRAEQKGAQLRKEYERNEVVLARLEKDVEQRQGALGELYGIVRQVAGETVGYYNQSVVSAQLRDRQQVLSQLALPGALPDIASLEALWRSLYREIETSGTVESFKTDVVVSDGEHSAADVIRVGSFNLLSDSGYYGFDPGSQSIIELPSHSIGSDNLQPVGEAPGFVSVTIDPTGGVLLDVMGKKPDLIERIKQGRGLAIVIIVLAIVGITAALLYGIRLHRIETQIQQQLESDNVDENNPLGRIASVYRKDQALHYDVLEKKLDEVILRETADLRKGLSLIKILAAIAPMLGLLGTVSGMIETFQSITLFGTGDPRLMADGISQALVTTVLGIGAAVPLLLLHNLLSSKSKVCTQILEQQSAGFVALQADKQIMAA